MKKHGRHGGTGCTKHVCFQGQGSTARRDELLRYQVEAQQRWQQDKIFEVDAPAEGACRDVMLHSCMCCIHLPAWGSPFACTSMHNV